MSDSVTKSSAPMPESSPVNPAPFNIRIMDIDAFIKGHGAQRVTSTMIKEPSSLTFHPEGMYSELIFGKVGSPDRFIRYGYIELNTEILAPAIWAALRKLGGLYIEIAAGKAFAVWNDETKDFERVYSDPEEVEGASTGYNFFLSHFREIEFKLTDSLTREARVALLNKYRDRAIYKRYLVEPAGVRDITSDLTGKLVQDDVNQLYTRLLSYTMALPPGTSSPEYDAIRFNIQSVAVEIYDYIDGVMSGKNGFLQGVYTHRNIAGSTRNVISASSYLAPRPDDPRFLKPDETMVGLFQCMKAAQALVYHEFKRVFISPIFGDIGATYTVPLINPKTMRLEYKDITDDERQRFTSSDGISGIINRFGNTDYRAKPITIQTEDLKKFWLVMVYDDQDTIVLFRNIDDLEGIMGKVDRTKIRPLTWVEALYLVTASVVKGKHAFVTRYPVLGDGSCYPSKIHLTSTSPTRTVKLIDVLDPDRGAMSYPEYPILGCPYQDTVVPHSSKLAGLGGDFDGDTVSFTIVMDEGSNAECKEYLESTKSVIDVQRRFVSAASDLVNLTMHNMTVMR